MGWAGKMALAIVLPLASLAIAGAAYQQIATWIDMRRSPESGRLVNAGGLRLQMSCTGAGSPTVVLDSGLGDLLPEWEGVQAGVAEFARVCSYDRAGYGDSDAGPMPRTSAQIARELHWALQSSGQAPPYVLVGHSFGGYNVRVFAGKYPSEVAGIVLVDSPRKINTRRFPQRGKNTAPLCYSGIGDKQTVPHFLSAWVLRG